MIPYSYVRTCSKYRCGVNRKPNSAQPKYGRIWNQVHQNIKQSPKTVEKIGIINFSISENSTYKEILGVHYFHWILNTVYYRRDRTRWFHALFRQSDHTRNRQNPIHKSVQETAPTDYYLHWISHHKHTAKYSLVNTLTQRKNCLF